MPTAAVNGTDIYYEQVGHGPICLVMHGGLGVDHTFLRPLLDRLADRLRLVYYDHRCNGRSGRPPLETLTIEQLADDADVLAERLGGGPVLVLGTSYGGFVAQELALRHPERVAGMILIGTTPGQLGTTESPDDEQGPPPPVELAEILSNPPVMGDAEFAAMMRGLLSYTVHRADPVELARLSERTIYNAAAGGRSMKLLRTWSTVDRLHRIAAPTLVLVGRHDVLASPPQAYRIARRVSGAEVVVFDDSGHMLMYDEPDRFFDVVNDWLDRHALAASRRAATVHIEAAPLQLWRMVSDITRMGEWSPENIGGEWLDGADSPVEGARFRGHNRRRRARWSTECTVLAAVPGQVFTFAVGPPAHPYTVWHYRFVPEGTGTAVTESCVLTRPPGRISRLGIRIGMGVSDREADLNDGIRTTLHRLKTAAETASTRSTPTAGRTLTSGASRRRATGV